MKWIIALTSLFTFNAFAVDLQSPEIKSSMAPADKEARTIEKSTDSDDSRENRKHLKYQITTAFLGREYVATPLTLSLGYFLNSDDLLLLRYTNFNGTVDDKEAVKLRAVTLGYRKFLGNSFNIMPSLYYRRNTGDYGKEGSFIIFGPNNIVYEDIGVGFRVGNEWQWENFTLGCDWFGLNTVVKKLNHSETSAGIIDDVSLEKGLTITVLSFYLGYSF